MRPIVTIGQTAAPPIPSNPAAILTQGLAQFVAVASHWIDMWSDARAWTISEQTLGERFIDQIPGIDQALFDAGLLSHRGKEGLANYVDSHYGNYGKIVPMAQKVMTILFGVRITNDDDLDALDGGVNEYYSRPDKSDIPQAAVERAVFLKQTYYPISTYNKVQWDMSKFAAVPYAAPIPGIDPGTLYNGEIPGGGEIKAGLVVMPGALVPGDTGSAAATESLPAPGSQAQAGQTQGIDKRYLIAGALLIVATLFYYDSK